MITQSKIDMQKIVDDVVGHPPLPIQSIMNEEFEDENDEDGESCIDDQLMHWYNTAEGDNEDNFQTQVKSPDVSLVTEQQITKEAEKVGEGDHETDISDTRICDSRAARHSPGVALAAFVQRAAKADGKQLADSIEQVAINEGAKLTTSEIQYIEKFLATLLPRIARVANKSKLSFSESLEKVLGPGSDFAQRAVGFCADEHGGDTFSSATVARVAQGRANIHVQDSEILRYTAVAKFVCREIFIVMREDMKHHAHTHGETTREDIRRALRTRYVWDVCRKLGFGVAGQ